MIIDVHCHLWGDEVSTESFVQLRQQMAAQGAQLYIKPENTPIDTLLRDMDIAHVDNTVILGVDDDVWFKRGGEPSF